MRIELNREKLNETQESLGLSDRRLYRDGLSQREHMAGKKGENNSLTYCLHISDLLKIDPIEIILPESLEAISRQAWKFDLAGEERHPDDQPRPMILIDNKLAFEKNASIVWKECLGGNSSNYRAIHFEQKRLQPENVWIDSYLDTDFKVCNKFIVDQHIHIAPIKIHFEPDLASQLAPNMAKESSEILIQIEKLHEVIDIARKIEPIDSSPDWLDTNIQALKENSTGPSSLDLIFRSLAELGTRVIFQKRLAKTSFFAETSLTEHKEIELFPRIRMTELHFFLVPTKGRIAAARIKFSKHSHRKFTVRESLDWHKFLTRDELVNKMQQHKEHGNG